MRLELLWVLYYFVIKDNLLFLILKLKWMQLPLESFPLVIFGLTAFWVQIQSAELFTRHGTTLHKRLELNASWNRNSWFSMINVQIVQQEVRDIFYLSSDLLIIFRQPADRSMSYEESYKSFADQSNRNMEIISSSLYHIGFIMSLLLFQHHPPLNFSEILLTPFVTLSVPFLPSSHLRPSSPSLWDKISLCNLLRRPFWSTLRVIN